MKHAGGGYGVSSGGAVLTHRPGDEHWHLTPRWHWRYWIGHRMRRYDLVSIPYEHDWNYRTFGQHARAVLEEQANGKAKATGQQRSATYIHNGG